MRPIDFVIFFVLFFSLQDISPTFALGNRAGEITYEKIGEYKYRIKLTIYIATDVPASKPEIELLFGDGNSQMVSRTSETYLANKTKQNTYVTEHKYSGPGTFIISIQEPNRNSGIRNIPNSANIPLSLKTILQINTSLGENNSPVFENISVSRVQVHATFNYKPSGYDPDGDSLSYKLVTCLGENTEPIENYFIPEASKAFAVNPINGDLIWENPMFLGYYNIAIEVEEWRKGVKIGSIVRDIQFEVVDELTTVPGLSQSKIRVYPCPTNDILFLNFSNKETKWVKIIDLKGKIVFQKSPLLKKDQLSLASLPSGIYFVVVQMETETSITQIVKE